MSQESDVCCTTSMYDIQNRCIPDEIDLFYFKTCIITHNNNVIEQNINVSMFDILSVKEPHIQGWNIQLCLDKLSRFIIYSYGKSVLSSTDFNLNAWEGYTNDIKQDLAENKSWLKVVCTCRNINTVNWRYGHKLACFTLEQILKSWIL